MSVSVSCLRIRLSFPSSPNRVSPRGLVCGIIPPVLPGAALEGFQGGHQGSIGYHSRSSIHPPARTSARPHLGHPSTPSHLVPPILSIYRLPSTCINRTRPTDRPPTTLLPGSIHHPSPSHPPAEPRGGHAHQQQQQSTASHPANRVADKSGLLQLPHTSTTEHWVTLRRTAHFP